MTIRRPLLAASNSNVAERTAINKLLAELKSAVGPERVVNDQASLAAYEYYASLARS